MKIQVIKFFLTSKRFSVKRNPKMRDLIVDPQIRIWVFLPIIAITFLWGFIKHYVTYLITSVKQVNVDELLDSEILRRSELLRENGDYIPRSGFLMRKHFFTNEKTGWLIRKKSNSPDNIFSDPNRVTDIMKNNIVNVLPMIAIGGWLVWMFSGFLIAKVPFPLTIRFKAMLQSDIELNNLDASWVSSISWYFLNVCGLKSFYDIVLGTNNPEIMMDIDQEIRTRAANLSADLQNVFKSEFESLEIMEHNWIMNDVFKI